MRKNTSGFTIVELLVVIVVIAILATITVVMYNGMTDQSRDTARRTAAAQVAKAIQALASRKDIGMKIGGSNATMPVGSDGLCPDGSEGGWLFARGAGPTINDGTGPYACTMADMLVANRLLPDGFAQSLPENEGYNNQKNSAMMLYPCGDADASKLALLYYLKNPTQEETNTFNNKGQTCPRLTDTGNIFSDRYKQRAVIIIDV